MIGAWIYDASSKTGDTLEYCAFSLLQALQQDFCVVEIALAEGDDSQEIFYSLNSQGRPLSQSDLLRSLVFMRAEKEKVNRDEIFHEYWNKFETAFWNTDIKRGGRTYSRLDLGLRYFLMAKTGEMIDTRRVNEDYRRWISVQPPRYPSIKDELADFARHGEEYQKYDSILPSTLPSTDLRRVLIDFDVSIALPLILFLELDAGMSPDQISECFFVLESFIARRFFTKEDTKEYNKYFVEIIGDLRSLQSDQIKAALCQKLLSGGGTTRRWPTDADIIEAAINSRVYEELRTAGLRLVLERLEIGHRSKKAENAFIADGLQIEHIMPRRWATNWPLEGKIVPQNVAEYPYMASGDLAGLSDAIRRRNSVLHTLGNLTLLNPYLNPAASNGSFEVKWNEYKQSVLRLNRYFDSRNDWEETAIAARGKTLGELLCNIWPRPAE